jgi:hypothetical protein
VVHLGISEGRPKMYEKAIKITWKAFSSKPEASVTFNAKGLFEGKGDYEICNQIYQDTNIYGGLVWEKIKDNLPQERSHTALSVGDEITLYDYTEDKVTKIYSCQDVGWSLDSYETELRKPIKLVGGSK